MANDIQLKRSSVTGKIPDAANVQVGEPVVNLTDKILYTKDGTGNVIVIGAGITSNIAEGTNLYFTNARVVSALTAGQNITLDANGRINSTATGGGIITTANVTELTNLYYSNARVYANVIQLGYITASNLAGYATNSQLTSYATTANSLVQFASTTSAQLAGVISDETGSGALVFATTPTLVTPVLGLATGTSVMLSANIGAAAGNVSGNFTAGNLQTTGNVNANNLRVVTNSSLGTVVQGTWNGSSISTTYTDAKVTSVNGQVGAATGFATTANSLSQFASTTSAQLATLISDETGSGALVFGTDPTISLPVINNIKLGYTATATAAGTTTLTVSSNRQQLFTGTSTQTVVLPVTSTLVAGMSYDIENNSTGNLTVNSSGGNLVATVIPGTNLHVVCIGTALTTAADWDAEFTGFGTLTGTGSVVLATSPTLVTPVLGAATGTSLSVSGNVVVSSGNSSGNGLILSDDGDIVDMNDGFASMRFSSGVKIKTTKYSTTDAITLASTGTLTATGNINAASAIFTGALTAGTLQTTGNVNSSSLRVTTASSLGTVQSGTWNGSSISTTYTDAKVTSVSNTAPISITTTTGAVTVGMLTSGVTATTYGNATNVPVFTVDSFGRITSASNVSISASSSGSATILFSDGAPSTPTGNTLWWQSNTGILKVYYTDADSAQWVDAVPATPSSLASLSDDTATNDTYYPLLATATSGSLTSAKVSSTKLKYNPSTGNVAATTFTGSLVAPGGTASTSTTTGVVILTGGLGLSGNVYAGGVVSGLDLLSTSDKRLKKNIKTIKTPLNTVQELRGVTFQWKKSGKDSIGVIAQEVEEVIPQVVETDGNGNKTVSYGSMVGLLIEAIKEQQEQINELKRIINGD